MPKTTAARITEKRDITSAAGALLRSGRMETGKSARGYCSRLSRPGGESEKLQSWHSCEIDLSPPLRNHYPSCRTAMMGTVGIAAWSSAMRRLLPRAPISVSMHKPLSRSVAAGRAAHQCSSSILKMIKRFHQRNAWTLFVTTFAATLVSTTIAWIWMLVGATRWAFGF